MAQLNIRLVDKDKETAEEVAKSAGYSLSEYFNTLVSYMVIHKTLPVVIQFKPLAIEPDEAFQQGILKFKETYLSVCFLYKNVLKIGEMTPLELLRSPLDDIQSAEVFYEKYESLIAMAPSQLEKISISNDEHHMFARCREHFPYILGFLRQAIRAIYMNNRPIAEQDLIEMKTALDSAAEHINALQNMIVCNISTQSHIAFFLRDAKEAYDCAVRATRPNEGYIVCKAWQDRMRNSITQAEKAFESISVVPNLDSLKDIRDKLKKLNHLVHIYLDTTSEPMGGFDMSIIEALKEALDRTFTKFSPPEKQTI